MNGWLLLFWVAGGMLALLVIVLTFYRQLLPLTAPIDQMNDWFGVIANWLVLLAAVVSAANASIRYVLSYSSNGWLEVQWYMFAAMVLLGGAYTLKVNEHVRVDLVYGWVSERTRLWIDLLGGIMFLLPMCLVLIYFTWPWFIDSFRSSEASNNAGGLIRWPAKLLLPLGFALLALQGLSEIIKRAAALNGAYELKYKYETPLQ
jgi:TRAP-type mannitol/chloroaromatic compound transport system permease small subunit